MLFWTKIVARGLRPRQHPSHYYDHYHHHHLSNLDESHPWNQDERSFWN
jgi:hypothetical protein